LRVLKYGLSLIVLVALVVGAFLVGRSDAHSQLKTSAAGTDTFYLDIGGSSSLGTQPTGIATHNGHRTQLGYANDLKKIEAKRGVALDLRQIGCPGETVESMLDTIGGDHCYTPPVTQLSLARKFLLARPTQPGVVTIDLGFNNIRPCLSHAAVNESCFNEQLVLINKDLPIVLHDLTDVAGPRVRFVGFEYEDPFLARYFDGTTGPALATETLDDVNTFNAALQKAYDAASIPIANLPATFKNNDNTPVVLDNVGTIPENVEEICNLTWMCQPAPFGPDDHPNNEGYMSIAEAISDELPKSW
jgi:lysophospholipase L1-like esterase